MVGYLARSLSGHDKEKVYVILGETDSYVELSDGDSRPKEKPKRKNKKHIQIIKIKCPTDTNELIKSGIRQYGK